jgi:hypothetical protein
MIKNPALYEAFERKQIAAQKADPVENMRIFDELYQFAIKMGKFSQTDPLQGIETKIRLASILRRVPRTP